MSVLSACQDAIARLVARRPNSVFASDDEICVEIASLANEAATDIAKANDWQALTEFYELTGDGVTSAFAFPANYDRMIQATDIYDPTNWCWGYEHITDYGQWILRKAQGLGLLPGAWIIRKNQFHFFPTPSSGAEATFPYVSNQWAQSATGSAKALFDRDDDTFVLDDRLLTLALIWRWKSMKGMDYQEDIKNSDIALSQAMARDKGSRPIRKGGSALARLNTRAAWPWNLG
ncbi:phage adaptor protein [Tardiphaga sp. 367_B4_N1_1]|uniref:phage adaptor protein n=1 Tax=Tardiphaga sp. 367_B4_N1_1 TaxID=3240777 RepID=UPI003F2204B7